MSHLALNTLGISNVKKCLYKELLYFYSQYGAADKVTLNFLIKSERQKHYKTLLRLKIKAACSESFHVELSLVLIYLSCSVSLNIDETLLLYQN